MVEFSETTIVVGKNNAGKSTLIEAIRLISIATEKFKNATYIQAPEWTTLGIAEKGFKLNTGKIDISFEQIINQYGNSPAIISATFHNNSKINIYINDEKGAFCCIRNSLGILISNFQQAKHSIINKIFILPQITPLLSQEDALNEDYVRENLYSHLSSRHFRNQMSYLDEDIFSKFKSLAQDSWPSLRIVDLNKASKSFNSTAPSLIVQESGYSTEIGKMGHGLQMWLQTIWFLAKVPNDAIIVLDEPDVYLHADLQRKLIRLLKGKYDQIIVATHSTEIMAEVDHQNILVIDRQKDRSYLAINAPMIQDIIYNELGSIHNLHLARLWWSKKFLIVEGQDIQLLKKFHDKIFPDSSNPIDSIPSMACEGWGGWKYAIGSGMHLKNAASETIQVYCILDRDYHTEEEISNRKREAKRCSINLHVWKKKEIENYFIIPSAIARAILKKKNLPSSRINTSSIHKKLIEIATAMREEVEYSFTNEISASQKSGNKYTDKSGNLVKDLPGSVVKYAKEIITARWEEDPLSVVSGKDLLKHLNIWLTKEFSTNINLIEISDSITKNEINQEMIKVLSTIEQSVSFES